MPSLSATSSATSNATPPAFHALDAEACYRALCAKDARFDGRFFTGVSTTGIYCRPVCRVRTPLRAHCRFFALPAQAEQAGFRPCLRCRPELAPGVWRWSRQDAGSTLLSQAMVWMDQADSPALDGVGSVALRLGVSERHLRRLFEQHLGLSPLQYLQTRRLLCAKQLLTDTRMPVGEVALACGFHSVRRFHAAFSARYRLNPLSLRRQSRADVATRAQAPALGMTVRLGYRPPFDATGLMTYLARRAMTGVEAGGLGTEALCWRRSLAIATPTGLHAGALAVRLMPERHEAWLQVDSGLEAVLPEVIRRCRAAFDLLADPSAIDPPLQALGLPGPPGVRIAGCFDGFELAVRAVLGQQVSLTQATRLAQRVAQTFGKPLSTPWPDLNRLFPSAQDLLAAGDALAPALGEMGVLRSRQHAILALARAVAEGSLDLNQGHAAAQTLAALQELPGIGPWTAGYIGMRALGHTDVWPQGDAALRQYLRGQPEADGPPAQDNVSAPRVQAHDPLMKPCAPWRSYAAMRVWQHVESAHPAPSKTKRSP